MAIAFDATSTSGYQTAQSTYSWSHTCAANSILFVPISMLSVAGSSVTGVTYDGVALSDLTNEDSTTGACRVELWILNGPHSGTHTIAVTLSAPLDSIGNAISFSSDSAPTQEDASGSGGTNIGATDVTFGITPDHDGDWILSAIATSDTSITAGGGQTERQNVSGTLGSGSLSSVGPIDPAASTTVRWTNVGAAAAWAIVVTAVRDNPDTLMAQICM